MLNDPQSTLRSHLVELLTKGNAHADFDSVVNDLPVTARGNKPTGCPYTPWQLLEHIRIAQLDIFEFSRNGRHQSPKWPDEYWPKTETPPNEEAWDTSVRNYHRDLQQFTGLMANSSHDLTEPIEHAPEGQTLLREALLLADHTSYHLGQIVLIRKLLDAWK